MKCKTKFLIHLICIFFQIFPHRIGQLQAGSRIDIVGNGIPDIVDVLLSQILFLDGKKEEVLSSTDWETAVLCCGRQALKILGDQFFIRLIINGKRIRISQNIRFDIVLSGRKYAACL